jgi:hypothetical protein
MLSSPGGRGDHDVCVSNIAEPALGILVSSLWHKEGALWKTFLVSGGQSHLGARDTHLQSWLL